MDVGSLNLLEGADWAIIDKLGAFTHLGLVFACTYLVKNLADIVFLLSKDG